MSSILPPRARTFVRSLVRRGAPAPSSPAFPQSELHAVTGALLAGATLHGFLSGGGLRVVSLRRGDLRLAYGEAPQIEAALVLLAADYRAGGRPYQDVYGKLTPHYLTGDATASSPLDAWLRRGHTVDATADGHTIVVTLSGTLMVRTPAEVEARVRATGQKEQFTIHGVTYEASREGWRRGQSSVVTRVIARPAGQSHVGDWSYRLAVSGRGDTIEQALEAALAGLPPEATADVMATLAST